MDEVALAKLSTELTTAATCVPMVAIDDALGVPDICLTELASALTELVTALLWVGKSLLALLATDLALVSIVVSADFRELTPFWRTLTLVRSLIDFLRLETDEQYDGLLLPPQALSAIAALATTSVHRSTRHT